MSNLLKYRFNIVVINLIATKSPHIKKNQILTIAIIKIIINGTKNFVFFKFKHKYV